MLFLRSIVDNWLRNEKQKVVAQPLSLAWNHDQASRNEPLKLPSRPRTMLDALVTVHVTDVRGGFGVASKHKDRFESALLDRYARVPYHAIASRRLGTVRNQDITRRTSHGNGGNRGVGMAVDAAHDEILSPELELSARNALILIVLDVRHYTGEVVDIVPHRAFSSQRLRDPGPHVWRVCQAVEDLLGSSICRCDLDLCEASGRPVPRSWDNRSDFDDRGFPIPQ